MVWNEATRREIERIMQHIPPLRAHDMSELFRPEDGCTAPTHPERFASIPDPDDRKFAALAHAIDATLISNDDHLLRHRDRRDVTVLTPHELWNRHQRSNHAQGRT
jgi:predicted nucleic acid-binding protein